MKVSKKSIICNDELCFVCGANNIEKHHLYFGVKARKKSDVLGLWVYLCVEHHRGDTGCHGKNGSNLNQQLKEQGQICCMREYDMSTEEFIKLMGRSYI